MEENKITAVERLEGLLDKKDSELSEKSERIDELEGHLEHVKGGWTLHLKLPREQTLPVPRLEVVFEPRGWKDHEWCDYVALYRMVYRHFLGHCVAIPIESTKVQRSLNEIPLGPNGKIELPFRMGAHVAHDAAHLKLPAFAVVMDRVEPIVPSLREE